MIAVCLQDEKRDNHEWHESHEYKERKFRFDPLERALAVRVNTAIMDGQASSGRSSSFV
jgi:hypothetical protein